MMDRKVAILKEGSYFDIQYQLLVLYSNTNIHSKNNNCFHLNYLET